MPNGNSDVQYTVFKAKGRPTYVVQWRDPITNKAKTKSTGETTKKRALIAAGDILAQVNADRFDSTKPATWGELADRYRDEHLVAKSLGTRQAAESLFKLITTVVDPHLAKTLDEQQIAKLWKHLREQKRSPNTIGKYQRSLKAVLRWAHKRRLITRLPSVDVHQTDSAKGRPLTGEEVDRLHDRCRKMHGDRAESWIHLMRGIELSGLRISEAMNLTWDDPRRIWIDSSGEHPLMIIPASYQKSKKHTESPLSPEFIEFLEQTPADERTGFVFNPQAERPGACNYERPSVHRASRIIAETGREAGIIVKHDTELNDDGSLRDRHEYASAHDLRRTFGYRWATRIQPQVLMLIMRHSNIATTMQFYAQLKASDAARAMAEAAANGSHSRRSPVQSR